MSVKLRKLVSCRSPAIPNFSGRFTESERNTDSSKASNSEDLTLNDRSQKLRSRNVNQPVNRFPIIRDRRGPEASTDNYLEAGEQIVSAGASSGSFSSASAINSGTGISTSTPSRRTNTERAKSPVRSSRVLTSELKFGLRVSVARLAKTCATPG